MSGPAPGEEIAAEVSGVLAAVPVLGRYVGSADEVVVVLPRGALRDGLPRSAAGYPVRYDFSGWTAAELQQTQEAVTAVTSGAEARFSIVYDPRRDMTVVRGHFADLAVVEGIAAIRGVTLEVLPSYELTDAQWQARKEAFTATAPAILRGWADFPHDQAPRPLIVLDVPVRGGPFDSIPHPGGLPAATAETPVPKSVLAQLTRYDAPQDLTPLRLTHARHTTSWFHTDRGQVELSAWELSFADTESLCIVLDATTPIWWPRTTTQWQLSHRPTTVSIDSDGRTLHLTALGGALTEFLTVEVHESDAAVLVNPITRKSTGPHRAYGVNRAMTTTLRNPLGNRVLIDERGVPCAVVPTGPSTLPMVATPIRP